MPRCLIRGDVQINSAAGGNIDPTTIGSTVGGTVSILSSSNVNINTTGSGNTNIGNATGTTTFTGPVSGVVASLAVAGGGITTSGSTGAVTLTVPSAPLMYTVPNAAGGNTLAFLGTWFTNGNTAGEKLHIEMHSGDIGYSGGGLNTNRQEYSDLFLSCSDSNSFSDATATYKSGASTYNGMVFTIICYGASVSRLTYDIYAQMGNYSGSSVYRVTISTGTTWTNQSTYVAALPSVPTGGNSLTVTPKAEASAWSQSPGTQTVTLNPGGSTIDPFFSGGRNYLDINAPATVSGVLGAVRLRGTTGGSIILSDDLLLNAPSGATIALGGVYVTLSPSVATRIVSGSFTQRLNGSDVTQPIILTGTGSITTTGISVNIGFSPAYTVAPVIQITGIGSTATAYTYNVSNVTTSGFRVNSTTAIGGTSFYWTAFGN
jgi:hypothetical protein